jgi:hypothetical protein
MTQTEALRLALEALETSMYPQQKQLQAITAIKAALEEKDEPVACGACNGSGRMVRDPDIGTDQECFVCEGALEAKDEPAAWMYPDDLKRFETSETYAQAYSIEMVSPTQGETVPLYTTPPQRTWAGLTDEEIIIMSRYDLEYAALIGEVQKKLKEKNT